MDRCGARAWSVVVLALQLSAAGLWTRSAAAGAEAYLDTWGSYYQGVSKGWDFSESDPIHASFSNGPVGPGVGVALAAGESFAAASGYADVSTLNLGASAEAVSTFDNSSFTDARVWTQVETQLTVTSGTSGLNVGDTATLVLQIRFDGTLSTSARSWPAASWSHADVDAGLTVRDYALGVDTGEGWIFPPLVAFGASAELEAYDVYMPYWNYNYSEIWSERWTASTNIGQPIEHNDSGSRREMHGFVEYDADHAVDTGLLTLEFEAIVGHTLDFKATLSTYVSANHDGRAWAEFSDTLAIDVSSATGGVGLFWNVPEPASALMLGCGMLLLPRRRR